jgi:septum formation protein
MMQTGFVYLASQSPRRAQLLEQINAPFRILVPEDAAQQQALEALEEEHPDESPASYVQRVTLLKLTASVERMHRLGLQYAPVLCADTTVALDSKILGKPHDAPSAAAMLEALSGHEHLVLTAIAVHDVMGEVRTALSVSHVVFATLSQRAIDGYIASGEWQGKAGGYAIQGRAGAFVTHISGSYSSIMGLPLHDTARLLQLSGIDLLI